jgi:ribosome-associated protein
MRSVETDVENEAPGLRLSDGRVIPRGELRVRVSRSSGPGGQHVNKTSSRVELRWDLAHSVAITPEERARLRSAFANRLDARGAVIIVASQTRSQWRNRLLAEARLVERIERALTPRARRIPTTPSAGQRARRLDAKRRQSERKASRQTREDE